MDVYSRDLLSINAEFASSKFDNSRKDKANSRFTSSSATYDSHFVTWLDVQGQISQAQRGVRLVSHIHIVEFNFAFTRPIWWQYLLLAVFFNCQVFLRDVLELE